MILHVLWIFPVYYIQYRNSVQRGLLKIRSLKQSTIMDNTERNTNQPGHLTSQQPFQVMEEFKPLLRILKAFNSENFRQHKLSDLIENIFHMLRVSTLFVTLIVQMVLGYWFCVDYDYGMDKVARAFPIDLCILQTILSGGALIANSQVMGETIERLQGIIERGECGLGE